MARTRDAIVVCELREGKADETAELALAPGEVPRYPPVTSGQWLIDELSKSY